MRAVAAQSELHIRFHKNVFVTQRILLAKNSVIRAGAEREIVPMNSADRRARYVDLMKFFQQSAGVAGWKFDAGEQHDRNGEVRLAVDRNRILSAELKGSSCTRRIFERDRFQKKRNITE